MSDDLKEPESGTDSNSEKRSQKFEMKRKILKKAIAEGRGPEAISMLMRFAQLQYLALMDADKLAMIKAMESQPRSVRMLNLIAELEGSQFRYAETVHVDPMRLYPAPPSLQ